VARDADPGKEADGIVIARWVVARALVDTGRDRDRAHALFLAIRDQACGDRRPNGSEREIAAICAGVARELGTP